LSQFWCRFVMKCVLQLAMPLAEFRGRWRPPHTQWIRTVPSLPTTLLDPVGVPVLIPAVPFPKSSAGSNDGAGGGGDADEMSMEWYRGWMPSPSGTEGDRLELVIR
jgi:hypothetical protein